MKREAEIKELLVNNAIQLIAEGGFEKATTKELAHCNGHLPGLKMNEVYIYRLFGSKESLYEAAFACLDNELALAFRNGIAAVDRSQKELREWLFEFFQLAWKFILRNEDRCRCYVRYYYSIYFKGRSMVMHRQLYRGMIEEMSPLFKDEADVGSIMHSVFTTLLDFGIRVFNGELEDNEVNRPHIFNVLFCMMSTYFKEPVSVS